MLADHLALQLTGESVNSTVSTLSDDFIQSERSSLLAMNQARPDPRLYGRDVKSGRWKPHDELSVMS